MVADKKSEGFTPEEKAAMKARARELKANASKEEAEREVLAKIADMPPADRDIAQKLHAVIMDSTDELAPKTWYGMPAYAKDGKVVCFFQSADKFKTRYSTLGFNDSAQLDDGDMWPTAFALTAWTDVTESQIRALVTKALG